MNSIFIRRSIRKYEDKPVEKEKINLLLKAAMQAPSAVNQQPWEFIVVENKGTLQKLSEVSKYSKMLKEAKVAFIILGNKDRLPYPDYWQQDLGAATQNLLLEAVELGLGAVWIGIAPVEERMNFIKDLFKLPENILPFAIVSVGYPEDQENKFIDRYDEKRVHYEKF